MISKISRISLLTVNGPSTWPSVGLVSHELINRLKEIYPQIKTFRILEQSSAPIKDDLWIVPVGMLHHQLLKWLKDNFKTPYQRPRIVFFLGGEGAKQCFNLFSHKDLFRLDDEWVVSSHVEKNLVDHFFPGNHRTHVLFYPVAKSFKPLKTFQEKMALRKKLNLPQSKSQSLMLYAGRISVQKNIFSLLDVLEKNPSLYLIICGDVDSLGLPHFNSDTKVHLPILITEEIAKRKLGKRIEFRNFLSQIELKQIMQACDYQISLSAHYGEDFGYSIAQGLACGLKTVLSAWGGHLNWKDFLKDNEISFVDLDWSGKLGIPILGKNLTLPKKQNISFNKDYQSHFKQHLKVIVGNKDYTNRSVHLKVSEDLNQYWESHKSTPRPSMYESSEDVNFRLVVRYYQNKY